ncbi:hypothetical protein [Winogradskyella sp. SM1960]|uniref:hypothetical protein n=1 Tax=Winogradskyella sp. SM1960 TaxID=2865955 RepID=UPI001CD39703|nr:hypothetical protein [Winogradskyella sp. SM1960]
MHRKLLKEAFNKAKEDTGSEKLTHLATHLSDFIVEDSKTPYGERVLRDNYNKILNNTEDKIYLRAHAAEALSHYLGFTSYANYIKINSYEAPSSDIHSLTFFEKHKITLFVTFIVIIGVFIFHSATKQRWMVWKGNHYIEVDFDTEKYNLNQLKIYKEERIKFFTKVKPSCDYTFFTPKGEALLWYGKNENKNLEFFTTLGLHPETGKTLKPITKYMIEKYICN